MTDDHDRDSSFATISSIDLLDGRSKKIDFESSLDSYAHVFDRDRHNFTASSEISFANHPPVETEQNRTFTKKVSKTIINAFTGKPISPNPWRKLCTKNVARHTETEAIATRELFSPSSSPAQERRSNEHSNDRAAAARPSRKYRR